MLKLIKRNDPAYQLRVRTKGKQEFYQKVDNLLVEYREGKEDIREEKKECFEEFRISDEEDQQQCLQLIKGNGKK